MVDTCSRRRGWRDRVVSMEKGQYQGAPTAAPTSTHREASEDGAVWGTSRGHKLNEDRFRLDERKKISTQVQLDSGEGCSEKLCSPCL